LRRCFAETLPKKYDPAQKQAVEAGIRTCQGTREFSTLEKCVPHEFGHDVRNGFALEVRGEANCQGCLCEPRLTFGYHFDSDEECFCRRARAGQPPASREACYHPDELPALAPNDEIRLSGDAVGGVHVERAPFGGRLWYLGFAPVLGSGHLRPPPKERVLTINGTVPSSSDAAAKLLGGPLTGLRGIDLMRSGHLHRIAYVDRVVLDELFAELHRALAESWPQKACLDVRQSTEIYFRTQKYAFDDSC
jgi:hypothetical protein